MILLMVSTGAIYALFILVSWAGWKRTKIFTGNLHSFKTRVSVVIAARNEEENILSCLNAIAQQSYPKSLIEIIICDDHSDDQTATLVKDWITQTALNAKLISADAGMSGKKNALNQGVGTATGELIITTDADCTMGREWLSAMAGFYEKYSPSMICGMVAIRDEDDTLSAFQSLELLGLTAIGAAGIYFRRPVLCSGANLAYQKKIFEETGGYHASSETASGDDTALMFRIAKINPRTIHFLKSTEAIVYTNAAANAGSFLSQRKRWGSKVLRQKNIASILSGLMVFIFHISIVISAILLLAGKMSWQPLAILLLLKIIPEWILLHTMISFSGKKNLRQDILLSQIVYPFYVALSALLSQTGKYSWKKREVK